MRRYSKNKRLYTLLLVVAIVLLWAIEHFLLPLGEKEESAHAIYLPEYVLPEGRKRDVVAHNYYSLEYNEKHEQASWVAYLLTRSHLTDDDRKRPYFVEDPRVSTFSADWRNYKNAGFDRGHLCPAGDRRFSEAAYNETFYTSNISPMRSDFNAGVWNRLEIQVRSWAGQYDSLYVITGGVLRKGLPGIGYESVSVPEAFYKVIFRGSRSNPEAIAFLVPHRETSQSLSDFRVSIDLLEAETGINFFEALEDPLEREFERDGNASEWPF